MSVHLIDSRFFGQAWGCDELRAIFDEDARTRGWLEVLASLAEAQADVGLLPAATAQEIRRVCELEDLDFRRMQAGYEATQHSLLGILRELEGHCRGDAGEWICFGATVQDITDSWLSGALLQTWQFVFRSLRRIEDTLLELALEHRQTPMLGRTHGQPGSPISFGFKVSVWIREIRRHLERLKDVRKRIGQGQLAGGVGSMAAFGEQAFELQEVFCARLGLAVPHVPWLTARDGITEMMQVMAMIASTFDKIGHEVYLLQRPEVGELREGEAAGTVGSITMPHKRNPEIAEQLGTLARMLRHNAGCLLESLVHDHERDGRSWKTEWGVIPPSCILMGAVLRLGEELCRHLEVDVDAMARNLQATGGATSAEAVMLALADTLGRASAHGLVYELSRQAELRGETFRQAVEQEPRVRNHLSAAEIDQLFDPLLYLGQCAAWVDRVARLAEADRKTDLPYLSPATPVTP
ncbi:MAG: adenylosuccinate lyase family protein [Deltaproteobacteria bacterium]|nr:adenylosuccinate lyase family protein [Deltaproteobacteria bacterium]